MKTLIIGYGIQGRKRLKYAKDDLVSVVDPNVQSAGHKDIRDVPLSDYDSACVCTPNSDKLEIIKYLLENKKHVLVEKPLWANNNNDIKMLQYLAAKNNTVLYTAYNHRFEPNIVELKKLMDSGELGKVYYCRIAYGNGTAQLVKESPWRDTEIGVIGEIGSHLLDMVYFLFGRIPYMSLYSSKCFETLAYDYAVFGHNGRSITVELEASYLSWKNTFTCDIICEHGSAHANGLCKWGTASNIIRVRKLPSGVPAQHEIRWNQPDPTWEKEYDHFKDLCGSSTFQLDMVKDLEINHTINRLVEQAKRNEAWLLES